MQSDGLGPGPFKYSEARAAGLERWHIESRRYRRLRSGIYCCSSEPIDPLLPVDAVARKLPPGAGFSFRSAAFIHGFDGQLPTPLDVTFPNTHSGSLLAGVNIHRAQLPSDELTLVANRPVTSVLRTLLDLALISSDVETIVNLDSALRLDLLSLADLEQAIANLSRRRGSRRLRRAFPHAEPLSGSQMETRLRMLFINAGLPRPEAQHEVRDHLDRFVARLDLYYPLQRVGIEYDGRGHEDTLALDAARHNRLLTMGIRVLRFTKADVYDSPHQTADQVSQALLQAAA